MKKISVFFLTIAAAGTMFFAGCKKDVNTVTLGVEVEPAAASGKLYIDAHHNPVFFTTGEMVNVNGTEYPVTLDGTTYKVDVEDAGEGAIYRAAYPTSLFNTISETGFTGNTNQPIHLSRWQKYVKVDGKQNVQLPAGAIINGDGSKKLKFYNFGSLLEIQWKNTSNVSYDIVGIEVTVPGVGLYGDGVANLSGNTSNIVMNDVKKNRVNLYFDADDQPTVASGTTSGKYYIFLPPFENKNLTVRVQTIRTSQSTSDDQKVRTVTVNTTNENGVSLPRNYIVPMHFEGTPTEDNGLTGYFSVRGQGPTGPDTYKVVFSRGNLQHLGTPDPDEDEWRFAPRQYDFYGMKNISRIGSYTHYNDLSETVDLFAWSDASSAGNYGMYTYDEWLQRGGWTPSGMSGSFFNDWGNQTISGDAPHTWFTLTSDEWYYLFNLRVNGNATNLRGRAVITGIEGHEAIDNFGSQPRDYVYGFILMPDDWTSDDIPEGLSFTPASENAGSSAVVNSYTVAEWARLEAAGAMFLPAAGQGEDYNNDGNYITNTYESGYYWSSTRTTNGHPEAHHLWFQYNNYYWHLQTSSQAVGNHTDANYDMDWYYLRSVRLVKPAPGYVDPDGRSTVNQ